jgi:hypothetical protein
MIRPLTGAALKNKGEMSGESECLLAPCWSTQRGEQMHAAFPP